MTVVIFTDVDDTLLQTRAKCGSADLMEAARDRHGHALSFFNPEQQHLLEAISAHHMIPVTGRNYSALSRVNIHFRSYKVIDHGAIILDENNAMLTAWQDEIDEEAARWSAILAEYEQEITQLIADEHLALRCRMIEDFGYACYLSVKYGAIANDPKTRDPASSDVRQIEKTFAHLASYINRFERTKVSRHAAFSEGARVHVNANNMAFLPPFASKLRAVEFLKVILLKRMPKSTLFIGCGDSNSDLPFMKSCHYCLIPSKSQIVETQLSGHQGNESEGISGSYPPSDCTFLLQEVDVPALSVEEKERRLQLGNVHYSAMVSREDAPSPQYLTLFYSLVEKYKARLAKEILLLAKQVETLKGAEITIVSLLRAGSPIGVLLRRALLYLFPDKVEHVKHYSISIVRDKGIDEAALQWLRAQGLSASSILFVDGWTAKGVITRELKQAIGQWNAKSDYRLSDQLCVVSDISGSADIVATKDDYAIPSGILNSTVSGLVSRSMILPEYTGFHQCLIYRDLATHDLSNWFVDEISKQFAKVDDGLDAAFDRIKTLSDKHKQHERHRALAEYIGGLMQQNDIPDINWIKPGIAEATRVMLRRIPQRLILRDMSADDVQHLITLAHERGLTPEEDATMPFNAVAVISNLRQEVRR